MLVVNDGWDAVLLGCFFFGLCFALLSLVLGGAHIGGHHGSLHAPGHGHGGGHQPNHSDEIGPLNTSTLLAFVAWFGGLAYLARNGAGWAVWVSLLLGVAGGLVGAALVFWFLVKVIVPADKTLDPADYRLPGTIARVTSSIRAGGTGEIVYEQAGVRQVAAARGTTGQALARGDEVVVVTSAHGVALVEPWADFLGERHQDLAEDPAPVLATVGTTVDAGPPGATPRATGS